MPLPSVSRKQILLVLTLASVPLLIALFILAARLMDSRQMQEAILAQITDRVQRKITYSRANVSFAPAPSFTFHDIDIRERDGETSFLSARHLTFRLALVPLLQGKVVLGGVSLDSPRITISREQNGSYNFSDLTSDTGAGDNIRISHLKVRHGTVTFHDHVITPAPPPVTLEELDLALGNPTRGHTARLKLTATSRVEGKPSAISAAGSIRIAPAGRPLADSSMDLSLAARHLGLETYWPFYRQLVPFRQLRGEVDATVSLKGKPDHLTVSGELGVERGYLDYSAAFEEAVSFPSFKVTWNLERTPERVNVTAVNLTSPLVAVKGSCDISDIGSGDPRIRATATMPPFRLGPARHLIPYPIIATDVADFIRSHIKDGTFRLDEGRLDGRVSQILTMGEKENYNVLGIRARCSDALLEFGKSVPTFNGVSGTLELRGKDFILSGMKGRFGTSPISLEGKITDYPINRPSTYPFSMTVTPRQPEVAWLLGDWKGNGISFDGASTLSLTGGGETSSFALNGRWDLTGARFAIRDLVSKPSGKPGSLTFSSTLSRDGARIPAIGFTLAPLSLTATARVRYTGPSPLSFSVRSEPVELQEIHSYFPKLKPFQPAGRLKASVSGEARSWDLADLGLRGEAALSGVTFRPGESTPPLSNINGTILFRGDTLETSQLSATLGSSTIQGKGSLKGFAAPEFAVTFKARQIALRDLGLTGPQEEITLRRVAGSIGYKEGVATLSQLTGTINDTPLKVGGTLRMAPHLSYNLSVSSPALHSNDLLPLGSLERQEKQAHSTPVSGRLTLTADAGTIKDIPFRKLQATVAQDGPVIYVQPVEMQLLNGRASGRLRIDRSTPATPRYQVTYAVEQVSAEQLCLLTGQKNAMITGSLSLHGDLTARGTNQQELRRTALGNIRLRLEEGSIRKFPLLSKIFSILNVSQLLKLQLPDMVRNGMPYNSITGSISVKDGHMETTDLKIDSDAINISAIGSADMVKEELNLTVGIKPLQTVDKVVSKIPLVGWVLTGKDKTLLTAWFEAKGSWSDPTVTAIPVTSLSRGVLGIFGRLLNLPGKIITDTGEVILGN